MTSSEEKSFYNGIKAIHSTNNHFETTGQMFLVSMVFNEPRTTPPRVCPSIAPNDTHQFPANPPRPTTQTTLEKSTIRFECNPQQQPLWKNSLLGNKKLLGKKYLCVCVTWSKKNVAGKEKDEGKPNQCTILF